jgi:hypothetical protein
MSQSINITNFPTKNIVGQTQLTSQIITGSTTLSVVNAADFSSGYLLVGTTGSNISEIVANVNASAGTSITLSTSIVLQYNQFDPVYALFGNQLRIYRAADAGLGAQPADASFTLLATTNIDPTSDKTQYTDATGGGGYWYKITYYNSITTNESDLASSRATRGNFTVNYASIDEIRQEAGFRYARYIIDEQIDEARQAAQDTINGSLDSFYQTPFQPPISDQIRRLTRRLSAGYLRQAQYTQISDPKINGDDIVHDSLKILKKLQQKQEVIVNKAGKSLSQVGGTGEAEGWPNSSTATMAPTSGGAPRVFRMSQIQGQPQTMDSSGNPVGNIFYGRAW